MPVSGGFTFGPYHLDTGSRRLLRSGAPVDCSPRQFDVLHTLVSSAGRVVSKDRLIEIAWQGTAVGDSSVEKIVFQVRQLLDPAQPLLYIETAPRQGYRFTQVVTPVTAARAPIDVHADLAPHRAWIEGHAALISLTRPQIAEAQAIFERLVEVSPDDAIYRIGMANACILQYEATRAGLTPDRAALDVAVHHAHAACRLSPDLAEAWATLGFVLARTDDRLNALAASQRAARMEPDNWLHLFRLASVSWGEERYRAARRTLAQYDGFPMAHVLACSVKVARGLLDAAEHHIDAARTALAAEANGASRYASVAVHWMKGLFCQARHHDEEALAALDQELALEARGHLYARECCAQAWYAKGAIYLRRNDRAAALAAFDEVLVRVPRHPMAHAGRVLLGEAPPSLITLAPHEAASVEVAMGTAVILAHLGDVPAAVRLVADALDACPPGNGGWLIPLDPLLGVFQNPSVWAIVLQKLRDRAA